MSTNQLPLFFNYIEEKKVDSGYEALQDFFISWTIRLSQNKYKESNEKLNEYALRIVYALIFCKDLSDEKHHEKQINIFSVDEVQVIRQFETIDLIADITYKLNSETYKVILNIENKWYSNIGNGQLEKCYKAIRESTKFNNTNIIDIILSPDWEKTKDGSSILKHCDENNYKMIAIEDLKEFSGISKEKPSGNYMFDEYWTRFY